MIVHDLPPQSGHGGNLADFNFAFAFGLMLDSDVKFLVKCKIT